MQFIGSKKIIHHIIHHNDNDGNASAAVVRFKLRDVAVKYHRVAYGDPVPENIDYANDRVYIVDFSFQELGVMEELITKLGDRLVWIDHHLGALDMEAQSELIAGIPGLRQVEAAGGTPLAACELAWQFFFPEQEQPVILTWVGDWDTWRAMNTERKFDVWAFDAGLRDEQHASDETWWYNRLSTLDGLGYESSIVVRGRVLVDAERKRNRSLLYNQGFEATLITSGRDWRVLAVNSNGGKLTFIDYFDPEKYQAVMKFFWAGLDHLSVGLYSDDPAFDCNAICHELGHSGPMPSGGGQKGAGGFQTQWDHFRMLLQNPVTLKSLSKK